MSPRRLRFAKRIAASAVAFAYLFTNVLFSPAFVQNAFAQSVPIAPKNQSADFWHSRALALPQPLSSDNKEAVDTKPFPILNPLLRKLSAHLSVRSIHVGQAHAPTVLLIQDVHQNREAQKNIGTALLDVPADFVIAAEAARGRFKFERFRVYPEAGVIKEIADALLQANLISAVSWMGLVAASSPANVAGIDDEALYRKNIDAFKVASARKEKTLKVLELRLRSLEEQKKIVFSRELASLYDGIAAYQSGARTMADHVRALAAVVSLDRYPNLRNFSTAVELEASVNSTQAKAERERILRALSARKKAVDDLMALGLEQKATPADPFVFHRKLAALMSRYGVAMDAYPAFRLYTRYLELADGIDHEKLFEELGALTDAATGKLAVTPEQKELLAALLNAQLSKKLVNFELTPAEWDLFRRGRPPRRPDRAMLEVDVASGGRGGPPLQSFEDFYSLAEARNEKMVANLLSEMLSMKKSSAAVVAGGFHTPGLLKLLKQHGASVVVLSPKITSVESGQGSAYLNVFLRERTPLAKLFESPRLTLGDAAEHIAGGSFGGRASAMAVTMAAGLMALAGNGAAADKAGAEMLGAETVHSRKTPNGNVEIIAENKGRQAVIEVGPNVENSETQVDFRGEHIRVRAKSPRLLFITVFIFLSLGYVSKNWWESYVFFASAAVFASWTLFESVRFGWGMWRGAALSPQDFYQTLREAVETGLIPPGVAAIVRHHDGSQFRPYQSAAHVYDHTTKTSTIYVRTEFAYSVDELARTIRHELYHRDHRTLTLPARNLDAFLRAFLLNPVLDYFYELFAQIVEWVHRQPRIEAVGAGETTSLDFNPNLNDRNYVERMLRELKKEQDKPGSGDLRKIIFISDQHGGIAKYDALLLHAIKSVLPKDTIPADFTVNADKTLDEQFAPFGFKLADLKGKIHFHNLGDLMDRGSYGIKVFLRSKELVDAGLSDFVIGNHDLWMFLNLKAYHLPWGEHFDFKGGYETEYSDKYDESMGPIRGGVEHHNSSWRDGKESLIRWWAERLAEFTNEQRAIQKKKWSVIEQQVNGSFEADGKTRIKGTGIYDKVWASLKGNKPHQELWDKFRGWYLVEIYRGVRAVGEMSLPWWQDLLAEFEAAYEEVKSSPDYNPDEPLPAHEAWAEAITIMRSIVVDLEKELDQHMREGKWWVRAFHALNRGNYTTLEWWAKDWVFHEGWGTSVIKELNEIAKQRAPGSVESLIPTTNANYLDNPLLKATAEYYHKNFNLFTANEYLTTGMHAFLPVDMKTGEFHFNYAGTAYRGKGRNSVWEGMSKLSAEIRNGADLVAMKPALNEINRWYADNTTVIKPPNVADAINKFGPSILARVNGFNRLFSGHIPFHEFYKLAKDDKLGFITGFQIGDASLVGFTDHGMDKRFEGRGGYVSVSPDGISLFGYEHDGSTEIKQDPRTIRKKGDVEEILFKNPGVPRTRLLSQLVREYEKRLAKLTLPVLRGPSAIFYYLTGSRVWGIVLLLLVEIPVILAVRTFVGQTLAATLLFLFAVYHAVKINEHPELQGHNRQGVSFLANLIIFGLYVCSPVENAFVWALLPAAFHVLTDVELLYRGALMQARKPAPAAPAVVAEHVPAPEPVEVLTKEKAEELLSDLLDLEQDKPEKRETLFNEIVRRGDRETLILIHERFRQTPDHIILATSYNGHGYVVTTERKKNPAQEVLRLLVIRLREKLGIKLENPPANGAVQVSDIPFPKLIKTMYFENQHLDPAQPIAYKLIDKALKSGRIELSDIADKQFQGFLASLQLHIQQHPESMLRYLVVMGGAAGKGIFFQDKVNDLDLTVTMDLTPQEFALVQDADTAGVLSFKDGPKAELALKIQRHVDAVLTALAEFTGADKKQFLDPENVVPVQTVDGLELQFFGPVLQKDTSGNDVLLVRTMAVSVKNGGDAPLSGMMNFYVTASLLHLAVDPWGKIYPRFLTGKESAHPQVSWTALEALRRGFIEIVTHAYEWNPGTLLRVAAIEQRYVLQVITADWDFNTLLRRSIGDYILRVKPPEAIGKSILSLVVLLNKVISGTRRPNAAHTRLREAGILQFVQRVALTDEKQFPLWAALRDQNVPLLNKKDHVAALQRLLDESAESSLWRQLRAQGVALTRADVAAIQKTLIDRGEDSQFPLWNLLPSGGIQFGKHDVNAIRVPLLAKRTVNAEASVDMSAEVSLGMLVDMRWHKAAPYFDGDIVHLLGMPAENLVGLEVTVLDAKGTVVKVVTPPLKSTRPTPESPEAVQSNGALQVDNYGKYVFKFPLSFPAPGAYTVRYRVFNPYEPGLYADTTQEQRVDVVASPASSAQSVVAGVKALLLATLVAGGAALGVGISGKLFLFTALFVSFLVVFGQRMHEHTVLAYGHPELDKGPNAALRQSIFRALTRINDEREDLLRQMKRLEHASIPAQQEMLRLKNEAILANLPANRDYVPVVQLLQAVNELELDQHNEKLAPAREALAANQRKRQRLEAVVLAVANGVSFEQALKIEVPQTESWLPFASAMKDVSFWSRSDLADEFESFIRETPALNGFWKEITADEKRADAVPDSISGSKNPYVITKVDPFWEEAVFRFAALTLLPAGTLVMLWWAGFGFFSVETVVFVPPAVLAGVMISSVGHAFAHVFSDGNLFWQRLPLRISQSHSYTAYYLSFAALVFIAFCFLSFVPMLAFGSAPWFANNLSLIVAGSGVAAGALSFPMLLQMHSHRNIAALVINGASRFGPPESEKARALFSMDGALPLIGLSEWSGVYPARQNAMLWDGGQDIQLKDNEIVHYSLADILAAENDSYFRRQPVFKRHLALLGKMIRAGRVVLTFGTDANLAQQRTILRQVLSNHEVHLTSRQMENIVDDVGALADPYRAEEAVKREYVESYKVRSFPFVFGPQVCKNWALTDFLTRPDARDVTIQIIDILTGQSMMISEKLLQDMRALLQSTRSA